MLAFDFYRVSQLYFQLDEKLASEAAHISSQIDLLRQQQVVEVSHMSALP